MKSLCQAIFAGYRHIQWADSRKHQEIFGRRVSGAQAVQRAEMMTCPHRRTQDDVDLTRCRFAKRAQLIEGAHDLASRPKKMAASSTSRLQGRDRASATHRSRNSLVTVQLFAGQSSSVEPCAREVEGIALALPFGLDLLGLTGLLQVAKLHSA